MIYESLIRRDEQGVAHIVALSGGHDSTIMSLLLKEREPHPFNFICTPTGNELPEMVEFWAWLGSANMLGSRIIPIMAGITLDRLIEREGCLPSRRRRYCTRILKIEPYRRFLAEIVKGGPVVSYVGLRADEIGRAGGAFADIDGVTMRFPLREWGMAEADVQAGLGQRGITCPERTDCDKCYHQQIGEWWRLWHDHPDRWMVAEGHELEQGGTFREPKLDADGQAVMITKRGMTYAASSRDTWPVRLCDMRKLFEAGHVPTVRYDPRERDLLRVGQCRVCSM